MTTDQRYMQRCLSLASKALGYTYPNPLVGSVIVHQGKIIGEGWHTKAGESHAEVNAIASVKDSSLLKESVLYVNLEPCAHFGKTPPCADLIIEKEIPKVVIGCMDIFSKVAGKGIERLQKAGCEVVVGVLEDECRALNTRFFTFHSKGRPYIILKWAQTRNGLIAPLHQEQQTPVWISNEFSQQLTHLWRAEEGAILVGRTTVERDNPSLTVRHWVGKNPLRLVIEGKHSFGVVFGGVLRGDLYDEGVEDVVVFGNEGAGGENVEAVAAEDTAEAGEQARAVGHEDHDLKAVAFEQDAAADDGGFKVVYEIGSVPQDFAGLMAGEVGGTELVP